MEECRAFIGKTVLVASLISTLTSLTNGIPNFLDRTLPALLVLANEIYIKLLGRDSRTVP